MMNGGASPSSLVQQMAGGIPNWWSTNNLKPISQEISAFSFLPSSSSSSSSISSSSSSSSSSALPQYSSNFCTMTPWHDSHQELTESWSQLLLGRVEEEDVSNFAPYPMRKIDNWDDHQMAYSSSNNYMLDIKQQTSGSIGFDIKQETSRNIGYAFYCGNQQENQPSRSSWSPAAAVPASSPRSCVTTSYTSNILDFSSCKTQRKHQQSDHFSECNSSSGAAIKKPKLQASTAQSPLKVRKEKLGDRITALHQLVSPFGKTDTASVLLEAIGYIRFLQSQIEALSSPYLANGSKNMRQYKVNGEKRSIFPDQDHGQDADGESKKDLRTRGLCLVPVSFTMHVEASENGADFWAPNIGADF